ncbi:hypothetical protein NL108_005279 [Boleophthalmus pectinirostris]|nr:hypothetical protein NL108_005279 [Boleophthalmus pectinirostris]
MVKQGHLEIWRGMTHYVTFLLGSPSNTFLHRFIYFFAWSFSQYDIKPFYLHGNQIGPSYMSDLWRGDTAHSHNPSSSRYFLNYKTTCNRQIKNLRLPVITQCILGRILGKSEHQTAMFD